MLAPFWTDGRRALLWLAPPGEEVPMREMASFGEFRLGGEIRELEGQRLEGGSVAGPAEPWDESEPQRGEATR
jgi:hypothetical protein